MEPPNAPHAPLGLTSRGLGCSPVPPVYCVSRGNSRQSRGARPPASFAMRAITLRGAGCRPPTNAHSAERGHTAQPWGRFLALAWAVLRGRFRLAWRSAMSTNALSAKMGRSPLPSDSPAFVPNVWGAPILLVSGCRPAPPASCAGVEPSRPFSARCLSSRARAAWEGPSRLGLVWCPVPRVCYAGLGPFPPLLAPFPLPSARIAMLAHTPLGLG
jgi:hypothetical protein